MRFWYVSQKRERIFDHAALILFLVVLIAVLLWLFPQQGYFRKKLPDGRVDAVSIAYLELLARSAPNDNLLKRNLIEQLIQTGEYQKAYTELNTLINISTLPVDPSLGLMRLEILTQLTFENKQNIKERLKYRTLALQELRNSVQRVSTIEQRERLAEISLSLSEPLIAARLYEALANEKNTKKARNLELAIKWYMAAQQYDVAAGLNEQLADYYSGDKRKSLIEESVRLQRMLAREDKAFAVLDRHLNSERHEITLLIDAALSASKIKNADKRNHYLRRILNERKDEAKDLARALTLALGNAEIGIALELSRALVSLNTDDPESLYRLAQLYEWNGKPRKALSVWLKISKIAPSIKNKEQVRKLAVSLFDHATVIKVTEFIGQHQRLNSEQLGSLLNAYSQHSKLKEAIRYIQSYVRLYPTDDHAWRGLALLGEYAEDFEVALSAWKVLSEKFEISVKEAQRIAGIHWSFDNISSAYQVLRQVLEKADRTDKAYWNMLATIAWQQGDNKLAVKAIRQSVESLDHLTAVEADIFLSIRDQALVTEQMIVAKSAWQRFKKPQYLIKLMYLAIETKNQIELKLALQQAQYNPKLFEQNTNYWLIRADFDFQQGRLSDAKKAYLTAVRLSPNSSETLAPYLWFLINSGQRQELSIYIRQWQDKARDESALYQVYAVANSVLGNFEQSLYWFKAVVDEFGPEIDVLIDYADVLSAAGLGPAAWRLRTYVYQKLSTDPKALTVNQRYRAMQPVNRVSTIRLLKAQQSLDHGQVWLPEYIQQVWAGGRVDELNYWRSYYKKHYHKDIPTSQQLVVALHNIDKEHIKKLLQNASDRPSSQQANLVELADSKAVAQSLRLDSLNSTKKRQEQQELRRDIVREVSVHESGTGISYSTEDSGFMEMNVTTATVKQAFDNWQLSAKINQRALSKVTKINLDDIGTESDLKLGVRRLTPMGEWSTDITFSQRDSKHLVGMGVSWKKTLSSNTLVTANVGVNARNNTTALSNLLTKQDYISGQLQWNVTARDRIEIMSGVNRVKSRYTQGSISNGNEGRIRYTHHINLQKPSLYISTGYEWKNNQLKNVLPRKISQRLSEASLGTNSLLPKKYSQVFLSATIQHGNPHALNADTPTPRYLLTLGVAQRLQQTSTVFSVEAAVGVPVVGNDELALSYRYTSKPLGGVTDDTSHLIKLSYNYRFGR